MTTDVSPRRTRRSRKPGAGSIFAKLLVVAAVVELMVSVPANGALARIPGVPILIVVLGIALLVGLVFDIDRTHTVIALLGIASLAATLGITGTVEAVLILGLMSWMLGLLKGLRQ